MYSAVVYSRHTACEAIFKIPRNGNAPGNPPLPPPGGCGDDRFRRDFNSGHGVLELQKGKKDPIFVMVLAGVMKVAVALVEKFAA